jgi:hypothetical protein
MTTMAGYTKLFSSILASTIWREDLETRIVWITLLAMAGKDGVAEASVPGLADFARVSVKATRAALAKLMAPDEDSRSKEHEGRRIQEVDGGWLLLNHAKYRAKLSEIERREYKRLKQAQYRKERLSTVDKSGQCSPNVDSVDTSRSRVQIQIQKQKTDARTGPVQPDGFTEFWKVYPRRQAKQDALKAWKVLEPSDELLAAMLSAIERRRGSPDWRKEGGKYIPLPATWLRGRRWEDEPPVDLAAAEMDALERELDGVAP